MNTPEPFSQAWERQQQSGQSKERMTPFPSNTVFPSQMAQNHTPYQMPGMDGFAQQPPWDGGSPSTGFFSPPSTPFPAPTSQPPSWNGAGMPNPTGNLSRPNTMSNSGIPNPMSNPGMRQTGDSNSGHLALSNAFTAGPTTTNSWEKGANKTGVLNGSNWSAPPNIPGPLNNKPSPSRKPPRRNTSRVGTVLLFLGLALLVVTIGTTGAYMFGGLRSTAAKTTQARPTMQPTPTPTPTVHMQHQLLAKQYVAQMSLDDEIAQLLMVEHYSNDYSDVATLTSQFHIGSIILYGTAIVTKSQVQSNITNVQQNSKIPIFIAIDEEGWNVGRMGSLYPNYYTYRLSAQSMGQSGDPNVAAQQGAQTAKDMLSLGINMNLAPDVDVSTDDGYIGFDRRSFGPTPDAVIKYAGPYLKGLQTNGVVGTIKHFPGLGSIPKGFDPHAVLPQYTGTKDQLYQTDLVPFQNLIQSTDPYGQAYAIMPTDMLVPAIDPTYPAELSHIFITDILRNQLGFQGVIVSDSLHMGGVSVNGASLSLADACVMALQAGNDILEGASTYDDVQTIITAIDAAVQSGKVTKAQIDASVTRVLTLKMDFGVMPAVPPSASATPRQTPTATP